GNKRIRARLQRQKDRPIGGRMPIAARAISALPAQAVAVSTNQNTARCRTPIYTPRVSAGLASIEQSVSHHQRVLTATHCGVVATSTTDLIEPGPLVQADSRLVVLAAIGHRGLR